VAESDGLDKFEHADFAPVELTGCDGQAHAFHFRTRLFGPGVALDAFEVRDGHPAGYQFQVIGAPEDDPLTLLARLIEKIRRAISIKHLKVGSLGLQIADRPIVRGRIGWDEAEEVGTVKIGGDGEQAVIGNNGWIYVNLENTSEVVAFDPKSFEVKKRFPIGVAKTPTGLAYDSKTNRLFIGLRNEPKLAVMDATTGKLIGSFPIGAGVDYASLDPSAGLIFFSCGGDGTLRIYHEKSANEYEDGGTVMTQPSAKTMAFDARTKKIFLPAAAVETYPPADPAQRPQRKVIAGTFAVLVVGRVGAE